jgi:hypothetical protein
MEERHDIKEGQSTLQDVITISPDVVFRDLDGEAVLLNLATGTYFGLNEVGTRMWHLLHQYSALQKVLEIMQEEYEVAPEVLEEDLLQLVGQLCAQGLISVSRP